MFGILGCCRQYVYCSILIALLLDVASLLLSVEQVFYKTIYHQQCLQENLIDFLRSYECQYLT